MVRAGFVKAINSDGATPRRSVITPPDSPSPLKADASIVDPLRANLDLDTFIAFPDTISNSEILLSSKKPDHSEKTILHAMKAIADNDTLYHHQAMKQPDHAKFWEAMDKEIADQYDMECDPSNFNYGAPQ